jgi:type VI secretion system protein VasD
MSIGYRARWCCALVALTLVGCGSSPPKPVATKLEIMAGADINPDSEGRASPVDVWLFQLRTSAEFADAQYFPLHDHEKDVLGQSLISRDAIPSVHAGAKLEQDLSVSPDARFFGVMVGFRDPAALWHTVVAVPPKSIKRILKEQRVTIRLDKTAVAVTVNEK